MYVKVEVLCKEYGEIKGFGLIVKFLGYLFFWKFGNFVKNILEKC